METMMRFRRNSLAQDSTRIPPAGRVGGPTGLTRWAPAAGVAVALVLALAGVEVAGVSQDAATGPKAADASPAGSAPSPATAAAGPAARSGGTSQPARSS